jgi:hypothetical protein
MYLDVASKEEDNHRRPKISPTQSTRPCHPDYAMDLAREHQDPWLVGWVPHEQRPPPTDLPRRSTRRPLRRERHPTPPCRQEVVCNTKERPHRQGRRIPHLARPPLQMPMLFAEGRSSEVIVAPVLGSRQRVFGRCLWWQREREEGRGRSLAAMVASPQAKRCGGLFILVGSSFEFWEPVSLSLIQPQT